MELLAAAGREDLHCCSWREASLLLGARLLLQLDAALALVLETIPSAAAYVRLGAGGRCYFCWILETPVGFWFCWSVGCVCQGWT